MRGVIILMALIFAGIFGVYYLGGYSGLDATQQGKDARAAITPGMTWQQVVDTTQAPRKYVRMVEQETEFGPMITDGMSKPFDVDEMDGLVKNGHLPFGFAFDYRYSNSSAFRVMFDDTGVVQGVHDLGTVSDLYEGNVGP